MVGLGRMGRFHFKALSDLGYDVVSADPRPGAADYLRPPARSFDVTCVAVPIEHLAACAIECASFSRALLVEKPLAESAAEAQDVAQALAGRQVAVGYVERFNPQVRALARLGASEATFRRWNTRFSDDPLLDLTTHDIDLARHLGLDARYDTRAGALQIKREIETDRGTVDLCAHDTSPLHAQWHAFLSGTPGPATLEDAIAVLEELELLRTDLASAITSEVPA